MNDFPNYITIILAKVFILAAFVMGMISFAIEVYNGNLPL
jgi:hypothetical protein